VKFGVSFGALSPTIEEQLREQGLKLDMDPALNELIQRHADQITVLEIHGILTEDETARARKRLLRIIKKQVRIL
jgi:hypothetical protein